MPDHDFLALSLFLNNKEHGLLDEALMVTIVSNSIPDTDKVSEFGMIVFDKNTIRKYPRMIAEKEPWTVVPTVAVLDIAKIACPTLVDPIDFIVEDTFAKSYGVNVKDSDNIGNYALYAAILVILEVMRVNFFGVLDVPDHVRPYIVQSLLNLLEEYPSPVIPAGSGLRKSLPIASEA
ncbi:hypothetical protein PtrSN002B_007443 [Pyrenophora tritici-repentis]|uniref:Uncharacterized protein n=1 Tax=Pyrenophora tritici-repentis TaxID=45151 RepID=A0A2W1G116_9PLEO|nr:hypothetical protein PtrV1_03114 [Pyrenophora tritici-repentis]KAI0574392.1 hypothetical protein Alg130_09717 [Pyrenophora tritici-repentis]KAI0574876.1 hypothetical protein Alg215_08365 [Pyrenophora tritici-repentis]KAI1512960.1 hypothetical protein Ptr86124_007980 [Pyrenophora tritici-repentis]KAI1525976.1 hypothetical protein PtrSN001C_010410 [Pyrenophora tritici-repentis]